MASMTPDRLTRFYDTVAPLYGFWARVTESRAVEVAIEATAIRRGEAVLEVGVGTGWLFGRLTGTTGDGKCVGLDLSWGMLRRAQRRSKEKASSGSLCRADACALPFPAHTFDAILSCYMLDIFSEADIKTALSEFHRATKPGGRMALVVMARQSPIFDRIWMTIYHHAPVLVGGCRPVNLTSALGMTGWKIETDREISQNGFRSQVILARPFPLETRAAA